MNYTVGDIIKGMKRVVERHLIDQEERAFLQNMSETSWLQIGVAAMLATVSDHEPSESQCSYSIRAVTSHATEIHRKFTDLADAITWLVAWPNITSVAIKRIEQEGPTT